MVETLDPEQELYDLPKASRGYENISYRKFLIELLWTMPDKYRYLVDDAAGIAVQRVAREGWLSQVDGTDEPVEAWTKAEELHYFILDTGQNEESDR